MSRISGKNFSGLSRGRFLGSNAGLQPQPSRSSKAPSATDYVVAQRGAAVGEALVVVARPFGSLMALPWP